MNKLIIFLVLLSGSLSKANGIIDNLFDKPNKDGALVDSGGERPFPYGTKTQFPWEWVQGCWRSEKNININLSIKTIFVGGEKKIRMSLKDDDSMFTGVGSVVKDTVTFLRIRRIPKRDRDLVQLRIGGYCIDADITKDKPCKKILGLTLVYDTLTGQDQEDHVLIRGTEKACEDLRQR